MAEIDTKTPNIEMTDDPLREPEGQHPYTQDLNPDFLKGENYGLQGPHPEKSARTAYDIKDAHRMLSEWPDQDLQQIPILPAGARLEQGAIYIDLKNEPVQEFAAEGDMTAGADNCYVPKSDVPYWLWNRLLGR